MNVQKTFILIIMNINTKSDRLKMLSKENEPALKPPFNDFL